MLDPWIIEEIRKREERNRRDERPMLEIPLEEPPRDVEDTAVGEEEEIERGVVIVDFGL